MSSSKRALSGFTPSQLQNQEFLATTQPTRIDRLRSTISPKVNVLPPNSLPTWKDYPLDKKFPKVPANDDKFVFARNQIGQSVFVSTPKQRFDNEDPRMQATPTGYTSLHDPNLKEYFEKHPKVFEKLVQEGLVDPVDGGVKTGMKAFNEYRAYLGRLRNIDLDDELRSQDRLADAQRDQVKRITREFKSIDNKKKKDKTDQIINGIKREKAARELRNQLKEFKQSSGLGASEKARQDAEAMMKREMLREKVRARLAKLRRGERKRARKLILEFYCKQLYADMLRNAIKDHKKKSRYANLNSFVDAKREFQVARTEYMKALEEKRKAEKECHVNARRKHFDHVETHRIENLRKRAMDAQMKSDREAFLLKKFGMRWLNAVRQQQANAKTYHESVWHVRQQLMQMVKDLKKESGKVSFTNFIHGLVSLRPGANEPLPKMSDETKAIMNYILDLLIQTAMDEYKKQHQQCTHAYEDLARRRDILGTPHYTNEDFQPPPYSPREIPVIPFERPTFPCKHPCTDVKPWMKEQEECEECEEEQDEYTEAYGMVDEELRRIMGIATPREQQAIREIVGSDSSGEAETVVANSIKKSVEKLAREKFVSKIPAPLPSTSKPKASKPSKKREQSPETNEGASVPATPVKKQPPQKVKPKEKPPPSSDSSAVAEQQTKIAIKNSLAKLIEAPTESEGSSAVAERIVSKSLTNVQIAKDKPKESKEPVPEAKKDKVDDVARAKDETASEGSSGVAEELVRKSLAKVTSGIVKKSLGKLVEEPEEVREEEPTKKQLETIKEPLDEPPPTIKSNEKSVPEKPAEAKVSEKKIDVAPVPEETQDDGKKPPDALQKKEEVKKEEPPEKKQAEPGDKKPEGVDKKPEKLEEKQAEKKPEVVDKKQDEKKPEKLEEKQAEKKPEKIEEKQSEKKPEVVDKNKVDEKQSEKKPEVVDKKQDEKKPEEVDKNKVDEKQAEKKPEEVDKKQPDKKLEEVDKKASEKKIDDQVAGTSAKKQPEPTNEQKSKESPEPAVVADAVKDKQLTEDAQKEDAKEVKQESTAVTKDDEVKATPTKENVAESKDVDGSKQKKESEVDKQDTLVVDEVKKEAQETDDVKQDSNVVDESVKKDGRETDEPAITSEDSVRDSQVADESGKRDSDKTKDDEKLDSSDAAKKNTQDESKANEEALQDDAVKSADEMKQGDDHKDEQIVSQGTSIVEEQGGLEKPEEIGLGEERDITKDDTMEGTQADETGDAARDQDSDKQQPGIEQDEDTTFDKSDIDDQAKQERDKSIQEDQGTAQEDNETLDQALEKPEDYDKDIRVIESPRLINAFRDSCTALDSSSSSSGVASELVTKSLRNAAQSLRFKDTKPQVDYDSYEPESGSSTSDPSDIVKKSILKAVQSLACKEEDSCDNLSVSSGEAEKIVAKALSRVVESLRCPGEGDTPQFDFLPTTPDQKLNRQTFKNIRDASDRREAQPDKHQSHHKQERANDNQGSEMPQVSSALSRRYSQPGAIVHRYDIQPSSGDCDTVIKEMAKAVVNTVLPQGLLTRFSYSDERVDSCEDETVQEAAQPVMPQDLRDSVLRTLSNVQQQLDAIRHELQIHGVIP